MNSTVGVYAHIYAFVYYEVLIIVCIFLCMCRNCEDDSVGCDFTGCWHVLRAYDVRTHLLISILNLILCILIMYMCVISCRHITLFVEWRRLLTQQDQFDYCRRHGLANIRVKSFMSSTIHLLSRVRESLTPAAANLLVFDYIGVPNVYKQNLLRLILAWNGKSCVRLALIHICIYLSFALHVSVYTPSLTLFYIHIS